MLVQKNDLGAFTALELLLMGRGPVTRGLELYEWL